MTLSAPPQPRELITKRTLSRSEPATLNTVSSELPFGRSFSIALITGYASCSRSMSPSFRAGLLKRALVDEHPEGPHDDRHVAPDRPTREIFEVRLQAI